MIPSPSRLSLHVGPPSWANSLVDRMTACLTSVVSGTGVFFEASSFGLAYVCVPPPESVLLCRALMP